MIIFTSKLSRISLATGLFFILVSGFSSESLAQDIPYSGERIVIVADGNEHGKGDWAATPLTLAVLAAKELQEQVMVYAFSSHTWGSNKTVLVWFLSTQKRCFLQEKKWTWTWFSIPLDERGLTSEISIYSQMIPWIQCSCSFWKVELTNWSLEF